VCSGLGTLGSAHGHLDPPLRSPTSPILHRAVTRASVPTPFYPTCRGCLLSGPSTRSLKPSLATLKATSPTLFLISMFVLTHSWNLGDHNWRHTATRLVSISGWRKGITSMFPKKSILRSRLSLNHRKRTLRRLSLLQAYSRRIPPPFQLISRPRRLRGRLCHQPHQPDTPTHAAQFASPTHFFPEADAEQERRLKRMEETIRALQAGDARPDARHGDCSLFPDMRLPPKFKIPEFKTYEGTTDPRHFLRHY
ncbi:hypothetical protein CRG98_040484, partial [Punica granatum]